MVDRPILFSAPMIRALLAGRKTQTRRILKGVGDLDECFQMDDGSWHQRDSRGMHMTPVALRFAVGDRLWCREAFMLVGGGDPGVPIYRANWREDAEARGFDNIPTTEPKGWKPGIHMPRWASRLTLTVDDVRVQRLQEISEDDARAEGTSRTPEGWWSVDVADGKLHATLAGSEAKGAFYCLWNHINGPDAWDANPWVAALTFTVAKRNIDQMESAA